MTESKNELTPSEILNAIGFVEGWRAARGSSPDAFADKLDVIVQAAKAHHDYLENGASQRETPVLNGIPPIGASTPVEKVQCCNCKRFDLKTNKCSRHKWLMNPMQFHFCPDHELKEQIAVKSCDKCTFFVDAGKSGVPFWCDRHRHTIDHDKLTMARHCMSYRTEPVQQRIPDYRPAEQQTLEDYLKPAKRKTPSDHHVKYAFKTKLRSATLIPVDHDTTVRCYRCEHLLNNKNGKTFICGRYNIGIRNIATLRECIGFLRIPLEKVYHRPAFKCKFCRHFIDNDSVCQKLSIVIQHPHEDKFKLCPHWQTASQEPVAISSGTKAKIKHIEEQLNNDK